MPIAPLTFGLHRFSLGPAVNCHSTSTARGNASVSEHTWNFAAPDESCRFPLINDLKRRFNAHQETYVSSVSVEPW